MGSSHSGDVWDYWAAKLAFAGADGTEYVVYLSPPDAQWHAYRPVFDTAVHEIRLLE
ncbi:hypothetical protein ACH4SK_13490 [Streptomyces inhibens]|uniref:hypothetical protein n=1 Tax=Streptomyces inhibens TaxID=2293571 RepID=UPI003788E119